MAEGLAAAVTPILCRTHRHAASVTLIHDDEIAALLIDAPDERALRGIRQVRIGEYKLTFDHQAGLIHVVGGHADPLYIFDFEGRATLEANLYEPDALVRAGGSVLIDHQDHGAVSLRASSRPGSATARDLASCLDWSEERPVLVFEAVRPVELVLQTAWFGRTAETVMPFPPGVHRVPVPATFADHVGLALTTTGGAGGLEHKHMILGHVGMSPGRHFVDCADGLVLAPKAPEPYRYRSLLAQAVDEHDLSRLDSCAAGFHEVEILVPPALLPRARQAARVLSVPHRVTTFGPPGSDVDLVLWPAEAIPGGSVPGTLSWRNAADPAELIEALLPRLEAAPQETPLWESAWLAASQGSITGAEPQHGLAFCPPVASDPESLRRAQAREARRHLARSSPCRLCDHKALCANILPFPYAANAQGLPAVIAADGQCRLRDALTKLRNQPNR